MNENFIQIGDVEFPTLLAITAEEQEKGLMFQKWPPPVMSFIYGKPAFNQFWMKNCSTPLDIVFILNNKIVAIGNGQPHSTLLHSGNTVSDMVVELPGGTCKTNGINVGDKIKTRFSVENSAKLLMLKSGIHL